MPKSEVVESEEELWKNSTKKCGYASSWHIHTALFDV
jgi:hypothetical protein